MAKSVENMWRRVSASLDLAQWDDVAQKVREFVTDVSTGSDVFDRRVPFPVQRSTTFYLSVALLTSTLRNCDFQIPSGTLALIAAQSFIFLKPDGVSLNRVMRKGELYRLFGAGFVHLDATHVLFNINSLLEAGFVMEPQMGAVPFLLDVSELTLLSHGIYVLAAWLEKTVLGRRATYYSLHAIGFSSAAFALSVLTGATNDCDPSLVSSLPIPVAYHVWANLAITTFFFRNSNHLGHLCGILAGLMRVFLPGPFLWLRRKLTHLLGFLVGYDFDNRMDEESKLRQRRDSQQLVHHLSFFLFSAVVYLVRAPLEALERSSRTRPRSNIFSTSLAKNQSSAAWRRSKTRSVTRPGDRVNLAQQTLWLEGGWSLFPVNACHALRHVKLPNIAPVDVSTSDKISPSTLSTAKQS